ncbi:MAG: dihydroorotase, partial [Bdellovibrionales bacterium]|nr:dihydroorotase [Bdellovibrionales bacterium]
ETVAPLSANSFAGAVIMPNLVPPVDSLEKCLSYRERIIAACGASDFEPYMTLFFKNYSENELASAKPHIIGIKLYPDGITTNSQGGVKAIEDAEPTIKIMEQLGIPLLVHGETADFVMDREQNFLSVYQRLAEKFPKLHIVMEHITTRHALALLDRFENLFATVTLHHLLITLDDVAGGMLNPHLFCKPIAKRPEDRDALLEAALSAHPKLSFGSDSAPHPQSKKECCGCAAGVFTAPIALPILAALFDQHGKLENLQDFVSGNATRNYRINPPNKEVKLAKEATRIPEKYGDVVPMWAGQEISWRLVS